MRKQKQFQEAVEAAGGYYFIVRSIDEVDESLRLVKQLTWEDLANAIPF